MTGVVDDLLQEEDLVELFREEADASLLDADEAEDAADGDVIAIPEVGSEQMNPLRTRLVNLRERLTALSFLRAELLDQMSRVERRVAMAKGRISKKAQVEEGIESLRRVANEVTVGVLERAMTAILDDVLPEKTITREEAAQRAAENAVAGLLGEDLFLQRQAEVLKGLVPTHSDAEIEEISVGAREEYRKKLEEKRIGAAQRAAAPIPLGKRSVKFELTTSRGLPALNIRIARLMQLPDGRVTTYHEDIMEGTGGSVANVLSAGLRVSSILRSGLRPFCIMDEPDCWLKPTRVEAFTGVLCQLADEVGMQMLCISHHDPELIDPRAYVLRLAGNPLTVQPVNPDQDPRHAWKNPDGSVKPGFTELRLVDFESHVDTVIPLSPRMNLLTGENNTGKTAAVRGFKALALTGAGDDVIRHGQDRARVEVRQSDGSMIAWERRGPAVKNAHRQVWQLWPAGAAEPARETPAEDDAPPSWVRDMLNIRMIGPDEDIDPQIGSQKEPIFLLNRKPSERAKILVAGREAEAVEVIADRWRRLLRHDREAVRSGETEVARLRTRIAALDKVLEVHARLKEAAGRIGEVDARIYQEECLRETINGLRAAGDAADRTRRQVSALGRLPTALPPLRDNAALASSVRQLRVLSAGARRMSLEGEVLSRLPAELVPLRPVAELSRSLSQLKRARRAVGILKIEQKALAKAPATAPELRPAAELGAAVVRIRQADAACRRLASMTDILARQEKVQAHPVMVEGLRPTSGIEQSVSRIKQVAGARTVAAEAYAREVKTGPVLQKAMNDILEHLGHVCPVCSGPLGADGKSCAGAATP